MSSKGSPASLVPCSYGPWEEKRGWLQRLPSGGHMEVLLISASAVHLPPCAQSPLPPVLCSKANVGSLVRILPARLPLPPGGVLPSLFSGPLWPLEPEASTAHLPLHLPHPALFILAAETEPHLLYPFSLEKALHGKL